MEAAPLMVYDPKELIGLERPSKPKAKQKRNLCWICIKLREKQDNGKRSQNLEK